jgi:thiamine-monophosphate kinase
MAKKISDIGEFGLIARIDSIIRRDGSTSEQVTVGIGDDTASFAPRPGYEVLLTCDAMVEGRHFLSDSISPFDLGRRAMTQNISDIGAMGGKPVHALVSLGLRGDMPVSDVEDLYRGFLAELNPFGASIIGGNLTGTTGPIFIDITLIGEVEQGAAIRRSGAGVGDVILVTGYPGQSCAGLELLLGAADRSALQTHPLVREYNSPSHRAQLGAAIGETHRVTAMIDTSDGFLGDLGHLCEESRVGAELMDEKIPISHDLLKAAGELGKNPKDFFLGDSDDYELIITCRQEDGELLRSLAVDHGVPIAEVGRITATPGILLVHADGTREALRSISWDHFRQGH